MKSKTLLRSRGHATEIIAYRNRKAEQLLAQASMAFRDGSDTDALDYAHQSGSWRNLTIRGSIGRENGSRLSRSVRAAQREYREYAEAKRQSKLA